MLGTMWKNKKHLFAIYFHDQRLEWCMQFSFLCFQILIWILLPENEKPILVYMMGVQLIFALFYFGFSFMRLMKIEKQYRLVKQEAKTGVITTELLEASNKHSMPNLYETTLQKTLQEKHFEAKSYEQSHQELVEYFTRWVHQTKTPITAMQLLLEVSESNEKKLLEQELFKIEQYVDVALQYQRIQSPSNDFVFKELYMRTLVYDVLKKMSLFFIYRKISVEVLIEDTFTVTSDAKWLTFVLEQLISNAVKYSEADRDKKVVIREDKGTLYIEDQGIGISGEMLPRITQWNFTGDNGRLNKNSTGIGLALCAKITQSLNIEMEIQSELGVGTTVSLAFPRGNHQLK